MNFVGKPCPHCKLEFKENDDVVICSVCKMPHHKECWIENKACTTFGCTGTSVDINNYNGLFETSIDEDMQTFVGVNQDYFLKKFKKFNLENSKVSWNWASAFLGAYWYAYRKMYLIQFLYYVAYFFIMILSGTLIDSVFSTTHKFASCIVMAPLLILFIPFLISGIFGNYLYKSHAEKHVKIAKNMDDYTKQNYLMKKGGKSDGAVMVIILLKIILFATRNL